MQVAWAALVLAALTSLPNQSLAAGGQGPNVIVDACKPGAVDVPPAEAQRVNLQAMHDRFAALSNGGHFAEALSLAQGLEGVLRALNATKEREYAVALADLAQACDTVYDAFEQADALFRAALTIFEQVPFATQRSDINWNLYALGTLYTRHGRFADALVFHKLALAMNEKTVGPNSKQVAANLNNIATVYDWQGRYAEAERLYKRALEIEDKLGRNPLSTAMTLNNLAVLYGHQGRYADAEALYARVWPVYEKAYGPTNPRVAGILEGLGLTLQAQNRRVDADAMLRRALAIQQTAYGQDSVFVGVSLIGLGILHKEQGKFPEAEAELRQALGIMGNRSGTTKAEVARVLDPLGAVLRAQGKRDEAELVLKRALAAREELAETNHPDLAATLDNLATLYAESGSEKNALTYSRRAIAAVIARAANEPSDLSSGSVDVRPGYFRRHLANLAAAARKGLEPLPALRDEALGIAQWAIQSSAATAVEQMSLRFASGDNALASLVRDRQDLTAAARASDRLLTEALSKPEGQRNQAAIENVRRQISETEVKLAAVSVRLEKEFPDYAALENPKPLTADEVQKLLGADEALVFLLTGDKESHVFALTRDGADWKTLPVGADAIADKVAAFRRGLTVDAVSRGLSRPECSEAEAEKRGLSRADCDALNEGGRELFDLARSYELYQTLLGPIEALIKDKHQLLVVPSGALTALPFHLLVTDKPAAAMPQIPDQITAQTFAPYREAAWLIKRQAVTVLPAVASLKALRAFAGNDEATKPMIAFGDPIFNPQAERGGAATRTAQSRGSSTRSYTEFWNGVSIDRAGLAKALPRLPDTGDEIRTVATTLGAPAGDIYLREAASETSVKRVALSLYRIVYFATHGLVAGEVKGLAEPSLALSLPRQPSDLDDGLLTASEVAQLKLNADWVVLSACNTIAGDRPGAEALSGLARAFFYAGARALLVSHWAVETHAASRLTTATFDLLRSDPKLGRAEALRRAELAYLADSSSPINAYPAIWAPFEIVGEGVRR